jgi:hypothetical protein
MPLQRRVGLSSQRLAAVPDPAGWKVDREIDAWLHQHAVHLAVPAPRHQLELLQQRVLGLRDSSHGGPQAVVPAGIGPDASMRIGKTKPPHSPSERQPTLNLRPQLPGGTSGHAEPARLSLNSLPSTRLPTRHALSPSAPQHESRHRSPAPSRSTRTGVSIPSRSHGPADDSMAAGRSQARSARPSASIMATCVRRPRVMRARRCR